MRMFYHSFDTQQQRYVVGWASSPDGFKCVFPVTFPMLLISFSCSHFFSSLLVSLSSLPSPFTLLHSLCSVPFPCSPCLLSLPSLVPAAFPLIFLLQLAQSLPCSCPRCHIANCDLQGSTECMLLQLDNASVTLPKGISHAPLVSVQLDMLFCLLCA